MDCIELLQHRIQVLNDCIDRTPGNEELLMERGRLYRRTGDLRKALNDFIAVLEIDPENKEARAYADMLNEIFEYRYTEIYNM